MNGNMQAMLKQVQKMQKDMMKTQEEINEKTFYGESSFVKVELKAGNVTSIKIDTESLDSDDIEALQDMIVVAVNEAHKQIDKDTEQKMGKYTQGMPGLF